MDLFQSSGKIFVIKSIQSHTAVKLFAERSNISFLNMKFVFREAFKPRQEGQWTGRALYIGYARRMVPNPRHGGSAQLQDRGTWVEGKKRLPFCFNVSIFVEN